MWDSFFSFWRMGSRNSIGAFATPVEKKSSVKGSQGNPTCDQGKVGNESNGIKSSFFSSLKSDSNKVRQIQEWHFIHEKLIKAKQQGFIFIDQAIEKVQEDICRMQGELLNRSVQWEEVLKIRQKDVSARFLNQSRRVVF